MKTICQVCMHHCSLEPGQTGICRARKNEDGAVVCENYGHITSMALDPIEKKPLKMFRPGSRILSVGKNIPLHVTRFFPRYHMTDRSATEVRQVYCLAETAGKYLENVFVGNC